MAKKKIEEPEELEHASTNLLDSLGIKPNTKFKERNYPVYLIRWHPARTIDHSKYPSAHWEPLENSPQFATWEKAHARCVWLSKKNPDRIYEAYSVFYHKSEIPTKILDEILELPWYK